MDTKVIELKSGGIGEAAIELMKEVTLLVRELAREKRVALQINGTAEAINLTKEVMLKALRVKKYELDSMLRQQKAEQDRQPPHASAPSPKGNAGGRGKQKEQVKAALKGGTKPVEGGDVEEQRLEQSNEPLAHHIKFPKLEALDKT